MLFCVGDEVEILATGPARAYGAAESDDTVQQQQPDATVLIDWQGQTFRGNNQQVLLEQLENQGYPGSLFMPGWNLRMLSNSTAGRRS